MNRSSGVRAWLWDLQSLGAPAQGRVIRHGEIQAQELEDRANQPFGLPQCQPEHRPERQGGSDCQGRIVGLTASCRAGFSPPSCNGFLGEPDRETAPLAQGGVVLRPTRYPVSLLGNAVTASSIGFEWHGKDLWSEAE